MDAERLRQVMRMYVVSGTIDTADVNWLYEHYLVGSFIQLLRNSGASSRMIERAYELIEG